MRCNCEHLDHFPEDWASPYRATPFAGSPAHVYGLEASHAARVVEVGGICADCVGHMAEYVTGAPCDCVDCVGPRVQTRTEALYVHFREARARIARARREWEAEAQECARQGFRPMTCEHGTYMWTDWDPMCGACEEGLSALEEAVIYARRALRQEQEARAFAVRWAHVEAQAKGSVQNV